MNLWKITPDIPKRRRGRKVRLLSKLTRTVYWRKWRKANLDKIRAIGARYRAKHPDKIRARRIAWTAKNPGYWVEWRRTNPTYHRDWHRERKL